MAKAEDPEQLLAEALRAQATRAPGAPQRRQPQLQEPGLTSSGGLELLSGNDLGIAFHAPTANGRIAPALPKGIPPGSAGWGTTVILLVAVSLGLAAGAGAALLTLF